MVIAREEIFGPVQCVLKFDEVDEVIARANDNEYGLGAGVISENIQETEYIVRRLKAGTVFKNCYSVFSPTAPFGGFKNSGIGREMGEEGINAYLELKTVIEKI
jgi:aldehyde dehydrogenase (NAD+)